MTLQGKYVVELTCDEQPCKMAKPFPHSRTISYSGIDAAGCTRQARKAGWVLHRDGRSTCPTCSGKGGKR